MLLSTFMHFIDHSISSASPACEFKTEIMHQKSEIKAICSLLIRSMKSAVFLIYKPALLDRWNIDATINQHLIEP